MQTQSYSLSMLFSRNLYEFIIGSLCFKDYARECFKKDELCAWTFEESTLAKAWLQKQHDALEQVCDSYQECYEEEGFNIDKLEPGIQRQMRILERLMSDIDQHGKFLKTRAKVRI